MRTQDFRKGGRAENLKIIKTRRKISPFRISPFSCPKLGKDKKKGLHSKLVRFLDQNWVKTKKDRSLARFCPFVCSNFLPKLQRGRPCCNFAYYSMLIILPWRPKGGGAMAPCPHLKYVPGTNYIVFRFII